MSHTDGVAYIDSMGRRHLALAVGLLGLLVWQVWAGGAPVDAREVVSVAERPRDARVLRIERVAAPVLDDLEEIEVGRHFEAALGVGADAEDGDGLTDAERQAGVVAELEDRLVPGRGAVQGEVRDLASDERLAGVTVVVTSPALDGAQTAITDEHGFYAITDLPPGIYLVTFYYLEVTVERSGIAVAAKEAHEVSHRLEMPKEQPRVVVRLDGHDDPDDETEVVSSFHCGTSSTNTYYVDGIDLTGLEFGDGANTGVTVTTDHVEIRPQIDEPDAFQEPTR